MLSTFDLWGGVTTSAPPRRPDPSGVGACSQANSPRDQQGILQEAAEVTEESELSLWRALRRQRYPNPIRLPRITQMGANRPTSIRVICAIRGKGSFNSAALWGGVT